MVAEAVAGRAGPLAGRIAFVALVVVALVAGVIGGLLRAGVAVPVPAQAAWPGQAVLSHAFLMMSAFMGTVIGLERAVAAKRVAAFAAPAASAASGLLMLAGAAAPARWLGVLAALVFVFVNAALWARQRAVHTAWLLAGALAWLVGNTLFALGATVAVATPWWFCFLILTIAAERLEMTRLMRRRRGASALLLACLATLLVAAVAFVVAPAIGGVLFGVSLIALAAWLATFDIARRTIAAQGLSRYMAICLLTGYGWLAVSGLAWLATALGHAARDVALHALGLGFVFSMMLGHAPVILPALTRVKVQFGWFFYLPLILLHVSLAVRLLLGGVDFRYLSWGAAGNAAAIVLFAATMAGAAWLWRRQHAPAHAAAARD
ncbi:MAG TPA: hypothetical protein VI032_12135 [Burkholderiaceae bacterium]